ncbi:MAG: hypothetical protein IKY66_03470 [Bacteroidales bacterium]|nr:hypothetical protein [Bacteroidales bacterium]
MKPRTKQATLTFKRSEVLLDIGNYAYVVGDIMQVDTEHARHQVLDICQEGNIDRVSRVLNLAYSEVVEMLYPYTKELCEKVETTSNDLDAPQEYIITMELPDDFAKSSVTLLTKLIHEYFVYRILEDWLSITAGKYAEVWDKKIENIRSKIHSAKNKRAGRVRRTSSPF